MAGKRGILLWAIFASSIYSIDRLLDQEKNATEISKHLQQVCLGFLFDDIGICIDLEPVPVRYSEIFKREKAQSEMGGVFRKKKNVYPIAPDGKDSEKIPREICEFLISKYPEFHLPDGIQTKTDQTSGNERI